MCSLWEKIVNVLPLGENCKYIPSGRNCGKWKKIVNVLPLGEKKVNVLQRKL